MNTIYSARATLTHFKDAFLCAALLVVLCLPNFSYADGRKRTQGELQAGDQAYDFTLKSHLNENIRLNELRGNFIILEFWASWSASSTRFLGQFEELFQKHKDENFKVLSVNLDPNKSGYVLDKLQPEHPILFDEDKKISRRYAIDTIPSFYLLDEGGKVLLTLKGNEPRNFDILKNRIETLLEGGSI